MSQYCDRGYVESLFGAVNVREWADLDNNGDDSVIDAAVIAEIEAASNYVDERLAASGYVVPFEDPPPQSVRYHAALKTGVLLYERKGTQYESETGRPTHQYKWHNDQVEAWLRDVVNGRRQITGATRTRERAPTILARDDLS
jgi:hypothetical protein